MFIEVVLIRDCRPGAMFLISESISIQLRHQLRCSACITLLKQYRLADTNLEILIAWRRVKRLRSTKV